MFVKLKSIREEQESGFTLIELLVVILIIGILAAIAIPMFMNQRKSAVDAQVQSDVKNAATQIETWAVSKPNAQAVATGSSILVTGTATGTTAVTAPTAGGDTTPVTSAKLSNGTKILVESTAVGVYTLCAWNTGGDASVGGAGTTKNFITYDSTSGGLKAVTGTTVPGICS